MILNPQMKLVMETGADKRRENLPTSSEMAVIIPDEYGEPCFRDIVLATRNTDTDGQSFSHIDPSHAAYMPLHYVLLFPQGDLGFHWALRLHNDERRRKVERLSQRAFYRYRLHIRSQEPDTLFLGARLFQQYVIDAWASCDQNKLN